MVRLFLLFVSIISFEIINVSAQGINYPGNNPTATSGAGNARTDADNLFIRNNPAALTEIPINDEEEQNGVTTTNSTGGWRVMGEVQEIFYYFRRDFQPPASQQAITSRATIINPSFAGEITFTSKDHKYAFGVGTYQIFGFQSKFKEPTDKLGAQAQFFDTKTASNDLAVGGAVRLNPKLSIGGTFFFGRAFLDSKRPIPQLAALGIIQQSRLDVAAIGGYGGSLGISYRPSRKIGFGINYKSSRHYELHGELQAVQPVLTTGGGVRFIPFSSDVNVEVKLPSIVETGIQIRPTKKLLLDADFRFYHYSAALKSLLVTDKQTGNLLSSQRIDAKDVYLFIFGGVYALNEQTKLHFGSSYITNGFPAGSINPGLVNTGGSELNFGVGKKISNRWINVGVTGVFGNERNISSTQNQLFPGKYRSKGFIIGIGLRSKI
ncbi:MAG: hypothetical protein NVSMB56_01140 [Pyrinomonadaceae bacterium]